MTQVKEGDTVRIHYKGTLTDGTVFDSSEGRDPLEFAVGSGQIIPGLDKAGGCFPRKNWNLPGGT